MARGPRTTATVRELVLQVFDEEWQKAGGRPDSVPTGVAVQARVAAEIERRRLPDHLPTERVVQRILAVPRRHAREKSDIDAPWSLGWGMEVPDPLIPQDAIPDLLELKRYSLIVHRPFTVRQARWAARLRLVPRAGRKVLAYDHVKRVAGIFEWTIRYSGRQRRSELADLPLDTTDLDDVLALDPHLHWAAIVTGHSTYRTFDEHARERESLGEEKSGVESMVDSLVDQLEGHEDIGHFSAEAQRIISEELVVLNRVSESRKRVVLDLWSYWLHEFEARGQHWESLQQGGSLGELAQRLLEGIVAHEAEILDEDGSTRSDTFEDADTHPITSPTSLIFGSRPTPIPYVPVQELLDRAGYKWSWTIAFPAVYDWEQTEWEPEGAAQ